MYYLQSRYYDPAIGRFVGADAYASTGHGIIGFNMYAYCYNNPINYLDSSGCLPKWLDTIVDTARNIWNAITDFFNPETGSISGTYDDGSTKGNATVTAGYSDISIGFTGQENVIDKTPRTYQKDGFMGLSAEASVVNANGKIGSTQNDNMGVYLNGTADALALSGYAGFQYKNGLGIGAGAGLGGGFIVEVGLPESYY